MGQRIQGNYSLHRDNRPQHVEMEDFVQERGIDLFYCGRIAAPCIVYKPIHVALVLMHSLRLPALDQGASSLR